MSTSNQFGLYLNQGGTLEFKINPGANKQEFSLNGETFQIKRTGFLLNKTIIRNSKDETVLEVVGKKWWSSSYFITHNSKQFVLKLENKPLATYAIYENEKLILSLGLITENHKPKSLFEGELANTPSLFHALLWYLLWPTIAENDAMIVLLAS